MNKRCEITIGKVITTFGRHGEVKVIPFTDHPEQYDSLAEVCACGVDDYLRILKVEHIRRHKGALLIKFIGIDDISTAEKLRGSELKVSEADLVPLEKDEFYIDDILGIQVITVDGEDLGKVLEVIRTPANDVYVTPKAMIPAVKEFVIEVDMQKKKMVVRPIEGMIQE